MLSDNVAHDGGHVKSTERDWLSIENYQKAFGDRCSRDYELPI